jgi:hypothetical protein
MKRDLEEIFVRSQTKYQKDTADRQYLDENLAGVKVYMDKRKNANSVGDYHILSNLSTIQHGTGIGYNGEAKEADHKKTVKQEGLDLSERAKRRQSLQAVRKQERPMPMRSELIDSYFN